MNYVQRNISLDFLRCLSGHTKRKGLYNALILVFWPDPISFKLIFVYLKFFNQPYCLFSLCCLQSKSLLLTPCLDLNLKAPYIYLEQSRPMCCQVKSLSFLWDNTRKSKRTDKLKSLFQEAHLANKVIFSFPF